MKNIDEYQICATRTAKAINKDDPEYNEKINLAVLALGLVRRSW